MNRGLLLLASFVFFLVARPVYGQPEPSEDLPFDNPLFPKDEAERKVLTALEEMRAAALQRLRDGKRLLRLLIEAVDAQRVVETGTSTGESVVWFALARGFPVLS